MSHWLLTYDQATRWALFAPLGLYLAVFALIITHVLDRAARRWVWKALAVLAGVTLLIQPYLALSWTPPERFMGDTYRIIYMHVPELFGAGAAITLSFGCCLAYLFHKSFVTDALAQASAEVGLLMGTLGTVLGAIWAKPTWGTWWTWDPRLTSVAIMLVIYVGYLALRSFVEDPEKRATWSAVMGIIGFVDLPVVWFSVKWWRSMHQVQSNKGTMDPQMFMVWQLSIAMFLAITAVFIIQRFQIVYATRRDEVALPDTLPAPQGA